MRIDEAIRSTFPDSRLRAVVNLLYTANWLNDKQKAVFEPHGLLPQHYNVLRIVNGRSPDPITPGEIREVMLDKGRDLTRLLDKLERCGLIRRRPCPGNRRSIEVYITAEGGELIGKVAGELDRLFSALIGLSEKDLQRLSDLLDEFRSSEEGT